MSERQEVRGHNGSWVLHPDGRLQLWLHYRQEMYAFERGDTLADIWAELGDDLWAYATEPAQTVDVAAWVAERAAS